MTMRHRIGAALVVVAAAACGENPPPPTQRAVRVTQIAIGRRINADKTIGESVRSFDPTDTVYVSVETQGIASRSLLKVRWMYEDGQLVNETVQPISPRGRANTEFHVSKMDGWPVGRYRVEIWLNGSLVGARDFEVK